MSVVCFIVFVVVRVVFACVRYVYVCLLFFWGEFCVVDLFCMVAFMLVVVCARLV